MSLDNGYVTAEFLKKVAQRMRDFKQLSYTHMAISPGDCVLDLGCGPGVDSVPLAALTGEQGKVIAIDMDDAMLAEAKIAAHEAQCGERIEHRHGDACALPLEDNSVDSCRAERLLQVLQPDLEPTIVAEMLRVTRQGGRIVLIDTDWASASVDISDTQLERRLMDFFARRMRPNGLAGRRLSALCSELALDDIRIDVVPMVQQRLDETPFGDWLTDTAIEEGIINVKEAALWQFELRRREQERRFYACVNMVIASGRKSERASA